MNLGTLVKNKTNLIEEKIKQIYNEIGFKGDVKNLNDIKKFILDNNLEFSTGMDMFGYKYEIIERHTGKVLSAFRVITKIETLEDGIGVKGIMKIEDIC